MIVRTESPKIFPPEFKSIPKPGISKLRNGIDLYNYNLGDQAVFKLELLFKLGSADLNDPSVASLGVKMLQEGTKSKTAEEINNTLDYYGSFLELKASLDHSSITLYGRSEFLDTLIPLLGEILLEPNFQIKSLDRLKQLKSQNLLISQKKTSYWSSRILRQSVFGGSHPYARIPSAEEIEAIDLDSVAQFHSKLTSSLDSILISGAYDEEETHSLLNKTFESILIDRVSTNIIKPVFDYTSIEKKLESTSQASISIGGASLNSHNPDYPIHAFIIKLLGGYFGSRLMKTLREDKGLTYGIHAYNLQLKHGSFLQIASDVKLESVDESIKVVLEEIDRLLTTPINTVEVETVKRYMLGEFVNDSNTAFDFADLYKKILLQDLPQNYYDVFYDKISKVSSDEVEAYKSAVLDPSKLIRVKVF